MTSVLSKGAKVKIELPTSMATVKVFVFVVANQYFSIPTNVINQVKFVNNDAIIEKEKYKYVIIDNESIPVFRFSDVLEIKNNLQTNNNKNQKETMIVIEADNIKIGFIADRIVGDQEVLHNKFNPPIIKLNLISGITTLISGDLCLILNASGLVNVMYNRSENFLNHVEPTKYIETDKQKSVLIVDDSISIATSIKKYI
ncbi:MAG: chemotaxis protein CheW [Candidatus Melainabacteria bacterium]|nr:MAG: chemotaxis protein CheW [Candidatus Melainabacteria bacterium]